MVANAGAQKLKSSKKQRKANRYYSKLEHERRCKAAKTVKVLKKQSLESPETQNKNFLRQTRAFAFFILNI